MSFVINHDRKNIEFLPNLIFIENVISINAIMEILRCILRSFNFYHHLDIKVKILGRLHQHDINSISSDLGQKN